MKRLVVTALLVACGGGAPPPPAAPEKTCRARLLPGDTGPAPTPRPSRIVADVELPLEKLRAELESKIPRRLAEERGRDIGIAGSLNYVIDRGPLAVAVEGESLVVRTDVRAHAEACAKGRCYAGCDPGARATASLSLRLGQDFRFAPARVDARLSDRCVVRVLFVNVDVTPTIQAQLGPALRRIEREIDAKLPPMRPHAERLWAELGRTRPLPLGGCVVAAPTGLVQGPIEGTRDTVRLRFAALAHPELRRSCGEPAPPPPLPPLGHDRTLPREDDVMVGLVAPVSSLGVTFPGETCNDVAASSALAWNADLENLRFGEALVDAPMPPAALVDALPALASATSDDAVSVSATAADPRPAEVFVRGDDVVARVLLRAGVTIRAR